MSRLIKGLAGDYSLLRPMGNKRGTNAYDKHESLHAWYQFGTDISQSGDLPDLSNSTRVLTPSGSAAGQRPSAPASINTMAGAPAAGFPTGFPTKNTNFSNDLILHTWTTPGDDSFSFGNSKIDQPFSVAAWIITDTIGANQDFVAKWATGSGGGTYNDGKEWRVSIKNDGVIRFWLADDSTDDIVQADSNRAITSGTWYHIVATYDGRGGPGASLGMKVYINGELDSEGGYKTYGSDSNYTAMENTESSFSLGNLHNEDAIRDFNGKYAEVAVWSIDLEPGDVKTLYEARYGVSRFASGIVSNPVRVLIREHDQVEGRYPLNLRTAPGVKKPRFKPFDDTNTFVFTSPFANAFVIMVATPRNGDFLEMTGSQGVVKERFIFWEDEASSGSFAAAKGSDYPSAKFTPILLNIADYRQTDTQEQAALLLMRAINSSPLDIRAFYEPEVVEKFENSVEDAGHLGDFVRNDPVISAKLRLEYHTASQAIQIDDSHGGRVHAGNASLGYSKSRIQATQFTVTQMTGTNVRYPNLLGAHRLRTHGGPPGLDGTASPFTSPDISGKIKEVPGITDANYRPSFPEHFTPFDDSKIVSRQSSFFAEGTNELTLPGFSSPLKSKTQIVLEMSSSQKTDSHVFYASGSIWRNSATVIGNHSKDAPRGYFHPIAGVTGSGMAYWSPAKSRWEQISRKKYPLKPNDPANFKTMLGTFNTQSPFDWYGPGTSMGSQTFLSKEMGCLGFALQSSGAAPHHVSPSSHRSDHFSLSKAEHNLKMTRALDGYHTPVVQWYFPLGDQYNATSSQVYSMSDYISSPFLLEKMYVEVDADLGIHADLDQSTLPLTKVLFILNQTTNPDNPGLKYKIEPHTTLYVTKSQRGQADAAELLAVDGARGEWYFHDSPTANITAHGRRELITWAKIGLLRDDSPIFFDNFNFTGASSLDISNQQEAERILREEVYEKILTFTEAHQTRDSTNGIGHFGLSASFGFNLYPKLALRNDGVSFMHIRTSSQDYLGSPTIVSNPFGGAALDGLSSGRHLAEGLTSVQAHKSTGSYISCPAFVTSSLITGSTDVFGGHNYRHYDGMPSVLGGDFRISAKDRHYDVSPYLLLPTDNLIIGWQNHTAIGTYTGSMAQEQNVDRLRHVKITMFGSLVRDNKEYHETLDQILTTNEIHETIYGEPVVDQWDVEPLIALSGSTQDAMIKGTMKVFGQGIDKASVRIVFNSNPFPNQQRLALTGTADHQRMFIFDNSSGVCSGTVDGSNPAPDGTPGNPYQVPYSTHHTATGYGTVTTLAARINADSSLAIDAVQEDNVLRLKQKVGGIAGNTPILWIRGLELNGGVPTANAPGNPLVFQDETPEHELTMHFNGGTGDANPDAQGVRGRVGSIASGHAGTTGSLSRMIGHSSNALYEDSLVAPISTILLNPIFFPTLVSGRDKLLSPNELPNTNGAGAATTLPAGSTSLVLSANPLIPSFKILTQLGLHNQKQFNLQKTLSPASNYLESPGGSVVTSADRLVIDQSAYRPTGVSDSATSNLGFLGTPEYSLGQVVEGANATISATPGVSALPTLLENPEIKKAISSLFYAAPLITGGKRQWPSIRSLGLFGFGLFPHIHCYKYGFIAIEPHNPKAYFRRDRYGQFSDMLEQPPETFTRGLIVQTLDAPGSEFNREAVDFSWPNNGGPVKSRFFSRSGDEDVDPLNTNSQNLSAFATSSMPYIDGLNVDRDVINHPPPDMTDKTSISEVTSVDIDPPS